MAQKGEQGENGVDGADGQSIIWKGSFASENDLMNPEKLWAYFNLQDGCSYIYSGTEWELLVKGGESTATTSGDGIRIPNIVKNSDNTIAWDAVENAYCYEIWVEINDGEIAESELIPTTTWNLDEAELFESFKETKQDTKFKYRIRAIADPSTGKDNSSWSVMFNGYYDYVAGNPYNDNHKQYGLGMAVNLLEGSYTDVLSGTLSIFDERKLNNLSIKEDLIKHGKGHSSMQEGSSIEEYLSSVSKSLGVKLGAKTSLFGVSFGMSFEKSSAYTRTVESRTEMYFLSFNSEYIGKEYSFKDFIDPQNFEGFLSEKFLNDARETQNNWMVSGNLEKFIKNYGTHVIMDAVIGAKFSANYFKIGDKESFGNKETVSRSLGASVGVEGAAFNAELSLGLSNEDFASNEDVNINASFDFVGGSNFGAIPILNGSNIGVINEEYSKWALSTSIEDNYALIDVADGSLFCVWDFLPEDEFHVLKEKLNEYVQQKSTDNYEAIKAKIGTFYAETVTDAIVYSFDTNNPGFESLSDGNEKSGIIKNVKDLFTESIEIVNYGYEVPCLPVPSLEYYDFVGWYTEDGVRVTDENGTVLVSDIPKLIEAGRWALDKSSAVLYSRWEKKTEYEGFYYISNSFGLSSIKNDLGGKYLLIEDVGISKSDWQTLCMSSFSGVFEGSGHSVFGLSGESDDKNIGDYSTYYGIKNDGLFIFENGRSFSSDVNYGGLFGTITEKAIVRNLSVKNIQIYFKSSHSGGGCLNIGILCGENNGTIQNVTVENCSLCVQRQNSNIGGIAGANHSSISYCAINDTKIGENGDVGGVCGKNSNGGVTTATIENCTTSNLRINMFLVSQNKSFGSIIGYMQSGEVSNCTSARPYFMYLGSDHSGSLHNIHFGNHMNCSLRPAVGWLVGCIDKGAIYDNNSMISWETKKDKINTTEAEGDYTHFENGDLESGCWFKDYEKNVGYDKNIH